MIDWLVVSGAFVSGLLGGAHCLAMCGGIATGLSVGQRGNWWHALQPNLGRIGGYVIAGAIVGGIGHGLLSVARTPMLAIVVRALVGALLILMALRLLDRRGRFIRLPSSGQRVWSWLRPLQSALLPANTTTRRLALGVLWGWLPCGLSTSLLGVAWLQASATNGALTMAAFGLGTLPVMLPVTWAGARVGHRLQRGGWRVAAASVLLLSGVLTVLAPLLSRSATMQSALIALGCQSVIH